MGSDNGSCVFSKDQALNPVNPAKPCTLASLCPIFDHWRLCPCGLQVQLCPPEQITCRQRNRESTSLSVCVCVEERQEHC